MIELENVSTLPQELSYIIRPRRLLGSIEHVEGETESGERVRVRADNRYFEDCYQCPVCGASAQGRYLRYCDRCGQRTTPPEYVFYKTPKQLEEEAKNG